MATRLIDKLKELAREPRPGFEPRPVYSPAGDCLFHYFEEAESYGDRVDAILTVYRALDDRRVVGFQIKGVAALLREMGELDLEYDDGRFKMTALVMLSNLIGEDPRCSEHERRSIYRSIAARSRGHHLDRNDLRYA